MKEIVKGVKLVKEKDGRQRLEALIDFAFESEAERERWESALRSTIEAKLEELKKFRGSQAPVGEQPQKRSRLG